MKSLIRKKGLGDKALCLFLAVAFLGLTSCSHPSGNSRAQQDLKAGASPAEETRAVRSYSAEDPWWKKPEYEWLIATLIVIGVGVAAGAAIMISSGAGGLTVRVKK